MFGGFLFGCLVSDDVNDHVCYDSSQFELLGVWAEFSLSSGSCFESWQL